MIFRDYIGKGKLFEGVIVINLATRPDRKKHTEGELAFYGIEDLVEWLPAISHRYGMVGCSLSHLQCVKIAKERGWKSVLIFEDDIRFTEHFEQCVERSLNQLATKNWAVYHFGAMLMNLCNQVDTNLLRIGYNWAAHAVAIHERVYDFILEKYDPSYRETDTSKNWGGHYPFDGFINKDTYDAGYEIYSAYPVLITQIPNVSDTWKMHRDYKDLIEASYDKQIMSEVAVIICSKNRPMQLHALLQSFFKYNKDEKLPLIAVLYKAGDLYKEAYKKVEDIYKGRVMFVVEKDFSSDYMGFIHNKKRYTVFLVDDTIFFKPFKLADGCSVLCTDTDVLSFSFRLGKNIKRSYINDFPHESPNEYNTNENIVKVDWKKKPEYIDFGYPFEVSSSMYRTSDILRIEEHLCGWMSLNAFELRGTQAVRFYRDTFGSHIATYKNSVAVSVPLNRVNEVHQNRYMSNSPDYEPLKLLTAFNSGYELDFSVIDEEWQPLGVHVELRPLFKYRT